MRPEDVPEELVKLAWEVHCSTPAAANLSPESMRHALAAVLPLAVAEERAECAKVARGTPYHGRYRTWPWWANPDGSQGNRENESDVVRHADAIAAAIRALPLPAGGSGWRDMTDKPTRPMPVLYWFGKRWWHQADGTPATLDPVRDPAERAEAGWWNGEEWCESGTGHDLFEPWREERDLPTHWQPLPAAPEEGG